MTVNVYKDWTGNKFDSLHFGEGRALKDCLDLDWKNAVVFCNGNKVNENYVTKKGDVVTVRGTPGSSWSDPLDIVSHVLFGPFDLIAEACGHPSILAAAKQGIQDMCKPDDQLPTNNKQNESLPALKGAKNESLKGKPIPFFVGQTRFTPYKIGNGYHSISGTNGENQRFHCLYMVGYNDISVGAFKFGETDLAYNGMSESYGEGGYELDIGNTLKKKGFVEDIEQKTPFAHANPVIEIANQGEVSIFSQKVVEDGIGKQIINAGGEKLKFTRPSAKYPQAVEVEIGFGALVQYLKNLQGEWAKFNGQPWEVSATIGVGISFDGGKTFEPFDNPNRSGHGFGRNDFNGSTPVDVDADDIAAGITGRLSSTTITGNTNKEMRLCCLRRITPLEAETLEREGAGYAWIRVERLDADATETNVNNKAHLTYIRTWVYDPEDSYDDSLPDGHYYSALSPQKPVIPKLRDKTTRVAVEIDATTNVADELDEFNCMVVANCKTWDSQNETWSEGKSPTANPAANALNLMQSGMMGNFAYGNGKIDLAAFGSLYEFCEENGFAVGAALVSQKKLSEVLDSMLNQSRAYRIVSGRKYSVFIDKPIQTPVCVLNNSNILVDGASNSRDFRLIPDGFRVKFINKNLGYEEDEVYVAFSDKSYDDPTAVIESIEMPFVTDPNQVFKNAWFEFAKRKLRPEIWKRSVTTEAAVIEVGSLVELQDDTIQVGIGNGGWIEEIFTVEGLIAGFRISSRINISDLTKSYGAKITHLSDSEEPDIRVRKLSVSQAAYTDSFALETPIAASDEAAPAVGDLVSIGEYGKETVSAICLEKKDSGDGKFELTLIPYDERMYTAGEGKTLEFESKTSGIQPAVVEGLTEYATKNDNNDLYSQMLQIVFGTSSEVKNPDTPIISSCVAGRDGIDVSCAALPNSGLNNVLGKVHWQVAKAQSVAVADISAWTDLPDTDGLATVYLFVRTGQNADGYPEWDDLNDVGCKWYFRAKVTNAYNKDSEWSVPVAVNVDKYGTWIVGDPDKVTDRVSGRTATLAFDQEEAASERELYGDVYYSVEIRKAGGSLSWYDPADDEDPYVSEENYKDGGSEAVPNKEPSSAKDWPEYLLDRKRTSHAFTQTLPLEGQNDRMYQYQWYYERHPVSPNDPYARLDSNGNPRKEGAGTAYSTTNPSTDWQAVTRVYGNPKQSGDDKYKVPGFYEGGEARLHGELGETGSDSYQTDVFRFGEDIYELIEEVEGEGYSKAFHDGVYAEVDSSGNFTLGGFNWNVSGTTVTRSGDTGTYDVFSATKILSYTLEDGFNPIDTVYQYKIRAFNVWGEEVVSYSDPKIFTVTALATSARDVVEGAITHNKLAEGAVWVDNLAAGSITAEKMAVKDLMAITGVFGKIQNNVVEATSSNKWDLNTGEFHIGNSASVTDPSSDEAEYIDFNPTTGNLVIKIANFIVRAISSIIQGVFIIRSKLDVNKRVMVAVNPESTGQTVDGTYCEARAMKVFGNMTTSGNFKTSSYIQASEYLQGTGFRLPKANNGTAASVRFDLKGLAYDSNTKTLYLQTDTY